MFRRTPNSARPVLGLWLVYFVNGAVLSSWAPRIPEVKDRLGLSDAALGAALFGVAAGSVPALLLTGRLLHRVDGGIVCRGSAAIFAAGLPAIATATGPVSLGLILAALGAASGVLDVAMNTTGIEFQKRRTGGPVLSRLHGGYSLGTLCGAGGGAAASGAGIPVSMQFAGTAGVLLLLLVCAGPHVPRTVEPLAGLAPAPRVSLARAITPAIAAVAVAGLLLEGVLTDWSALLVARDHNAGFAVGSTVVVAFSAAMFVSRSGGNGIVSQLGRGRYLVLAAVTSTVGTGIGVVVPGWPATYAGVVIVGLALGPVFPIALEVATEGTPGSVAGATAAVSAVGYLAHLGGPPLVGSLAQPLELPVAIAVLGTAASAALTAGAFAVSRPRRLPVDGDGMRDDP
ncbi:MULTISPECIES: MFS transporter [Tsukamurella]|nr:MULTISPECIES: MFS transporter [Tsukamurella]NMD57006.1 MFS transporter [Tsukamurella columbiensis]